MVILTAAHPPTHPPIVSVCTHHEPYQALNSVWATISPITHRPLAGSGAAICHMCRSGAFGRRTPVAQGVWQQGNGLTCLLGLREFALLCGNLPGRVLWQFMGGPCIMRINYLSITSGAGPGGGAASMFTSKSWAHTRISWSAINIVEARKLEHKYPHSCP